MDEQVTAMLDLVRLPGHGDRLPRHLSGGQQQRIALARALVFRPRVLLMDEPFGALDRALREALRAELRDLHRALGITVVLVTHDQDEAMDVSDRIAVMRAGRLEQVAVPRELYDRPASAFVAGFVGESSLLEAVVVQVEGERAVVRTAGGQSVRASATAARVGARVLVLLRPDAVVLHDMDAPGDGALGGVVEDVADPGAGRARPCAARWRRAGHGDPAAPGGGTDAPPGSAARAPLAARGGPSSPTRALRRAPGAPALRPAGAAARVGASWAFGSPPLPRRWPS